MFNLCKTNVIGSGCAKNAYKINDEQVILCSKQPPQKNDSYIQTEFQMIQYLHSFDLPIIKDIEIVPVCHNYSGSSLGLLQKYIKKSKLLKLNSSPPIKLSETILPILINTFSILKKHRICIDDLQFIYNENEMLVS